MKKIMLALVALTAMAAPAMAFDIKPLLAVEKAMEECGDTRWEEFSTMAMPYFEQAVEIMREKTPELIEVQHRMGASLILSVAVAPNNEDGKVTKIEDFKITCNDIVDFEVIERNFIAIIEKMRNL